MFPKLSSYKSSFKKSHSSPWTGNDTIYYSRHSSIISTPLVAPACQPDHGHVQATNTILHCPPVDDQLPGWGVYQRVQGHLYHCQGDEALNAALDSKF